MAPGRKPKTQPSTRTLPEEPPLTAYEMLRNEKVLWNSCVFRSMGIKEAADILKRSRTRPTNATHQDSRKTTNATREDCGSLYQPGDDQAGEDIDGAVDQEAMLDLEPELNDSSAQHASIQVGGLRKSKRVMAVALQGQDSPPRVTRQRTRELALADEVPTTEPQDASIEDALIGANDNTQSNNQNELPTRGGPNTRRHLGRDLDNISRGLRDKIPVHISEGKLRPEVPLQAAKLSSEAGIVLWDHVPIYTHWKHYKDAAAKPIIKNYNEKLGSQFTIDIDDVPVKEAFNDLLKRGQRQMRYKLKKLYFNGIPANEVRTTSPLSTMTDDEWKELIDMWSNPKHKEKCLKNKDSRDQVQYHQMTGSRSYVAQCYVMKQTKFKDAPPTAIDIFKGTHCSSKSGFNEKAKDVIAQMEAYVDQQVEEGQDPKTPIQAVAHVLPKSTFLRNVGMQSTTTKRNAKVAEMNDRVNELESKLQAEKMGSVGLQSKVDDLEKQLEDQKEAARKNEEETEKVKQQNLEIQGFLRTLFGGKFKFASPDAEQ